LPNTQLALGTNTCTSLSQLKLVNWSFPKINIPKDRDHWLPEIASVGVLVLGPWAPLGCLSHFIRAIISRLGPARAPLSFWLLYLLSVSVLSPSASWLLLQKAGT
jgi:hypothetical protein